MLNVYISIKRSLRKRDATDHKINNGIRKIIKLYDRGSISRNKFLKIINLSLQSINFTVNNDKYLIYWTIENADVEIIALILNSIYYGYGIPYYRNISYQIINYASIQNTVQNTLQNRSRISSQITKMLIDKVIKYDSINKLLDWSYYNNCYALLDFMLTNYQIDQYITYSNINKIIFNGNLELIDTFVKHEFGTKIMDLVIINKNLPIIKMLMEKYPKILINFDSLKEAYKLGNIEIIRYLLRNCKLISGDIFEFINIIIWKKEMGLIKLFLRKRFAKTYHSYILNKCLYYNDINILKLLLNAGYKPNNQDIMIESLIQTYKHKYYEIINLIFDHLDYLPKINWTDINSELISNICATGHHKLVKSILEYDKKQRNPHDFNFHLRRFYYYNEQFNKLLATTNINSHLDKIILILKGSQDRNCVFNSEIIKYIIKMWINVTIDNIEQISFFNNPNTYII